MDIPRMPQVGLNPGWSNDEYHQGPGISKSHLDAIAPECGATPLHYWAKYIDPNRASFDDGSRSGPLFDGSAIHAAVLEPDLFGDTYLAPPPNAPKRPSARSLAAKKPSQDTLRAIDFWEEFDDLHRDKLVVEPEQMRMYTGVRDAVHSHPVAKGLFQGGAAEQTYFARDPKTGEWIKCKADYERLEAEGLVIDLKSTVSASPDEFGRSATKWRYDVSSTWYPDVINAAYEQKVAETFVLVAVEKLYPHAIGIYYLDDTDAVAARRMARRDLDQIIDCKRSGVWPDHGVEPQTLQINSYARRHLK